MPAIFATDALAQQIDVSKAEFRSDGADALIIQRFQMQTGKAGEQNNLYSARFSWSPERKAFFLEPASLQVDGKIGGGLCRMAILEGPGPNDFWFATNPLGSGEFGGMRAFQGNDFRQFTISWYKGNLAANPYLAGRDVKKMNLKDGSAYGIVGLVAPGYKGFWTGQLIEVTGSIEKGGFQVQAIDAGTIATFSSRSKSFLKGTDCSLKSGKYYGDFDNSYPTNVIDLDRGGMRTDSNSFMFSVAWQQKLQQNNNVLVGKVGQISEKKSTWQQGDTVYVTPLGMGYALIALGPDGIAKTTAVLLVRPQSQ